MALDHGTNFLAATNAAATTAAYAGIAVPIATGIDVCFHGFTFMVKQ